MKQSSTAITAVLFDLDGTLLDTEPDFTHILNRQLRTHGRPEVSREQVRQTVSSGARALIQLGFGLKEDEPGFAERLDELLAMYDQQIKTSRCRLFPGMDRLLTRIEDQGLCWGIVTNKPSRFTTPLLAQVEGLRRCGVTVCRDQVTEGKPNPAGLLMACERQGCPPEQAVYVGDHPRDIEAGRNAGMPTIAAAWGYLPADSRVEDWDADFIAYSAGDIEHYLFDQ